MGGWVGVWVGERAGGVFGVGGVVLAQTSEPRAPSSLHPTPHPPPACLPLVPATAEEHGWYLGHSMDAA